MKLSTIIYLVIGGFIVGVLTGMKYVYFLMIVSKLGFIDGVWFNEIFYPDMYRDLITSGFKGILITLLVGTLFRVYFDSKNKTRG